MIDDVRVEEIGSGHAVQQLSRGENRDEDAWLGIGRWDIVNKCVVFDRKTARRISDALNQAERAQKFFEGLAVESRKPHFGEHAKQFTRALLLRAEEAGLYTPAKEQE